MWHFISEHISEVTGTAFICEHRHAVAGGDTHKATILQSEHQRFFVKTRPLPHPDDIQLDAEADGLSAIAKTKTISVPSVVCAGVVKENHQHTEYLVLQHLKLTQSSQCDYALLGQRIAFLHLATSGTTFGWHRNNFIGATPQQNTKRHCWADFFAEQRIGFQLELLARQGQRLANIDVVTSKVHTLLKPHSPTPSLVHGDLWFGNTGFHGTTPIIYDPAVYIGDRETDIAMAELFGSFPEAFYAGYHSVAPLSEDYQSRRHVYQLYHLLNHALLFGGHYIYDAKNVILQLS